MKKTKEFRGNSRQNTRNDPCAGFPFSYETVVVEEGEKRESPYKVRGAFLRQSLLRTNNDVRTLCFSTLHICARRV